MTWAFTKTARTWAEEFRRRVLVGPITEAITEAFLARVITATRLDEAYACRSAAVRAGYLSAIDERIKVHRSHARKARRA